MTIINDRKRNYVNGAMLASAVERAKQIEMVPSSTAFNKRGHLHNNVRRCRITLLVVLHSNSMEKYESIVLSTVYWNIIIECFCCVLIITYINFPSRVIINS